VVSFEVDIEFSLKHIPRRKKFKKIKYKLLGLKSEAGEALRKRYRERMDSSGIHAEFQRTCLSIRTSYIGSMTVHDRLLEKFTDACRKLEKDIKDIAREVCGESLIDPSRSRPGMTKEEKRLFMKLKKFAVRCRTVERRKEREALARELRIAIKTKAKEKFVDDFAIALKQENGDRDPTAIWEFAKKINRQVTKLRIPYLLKVENGKE